MSGSCTNEPMPAWTLPGLTTSVSDVVEPGESDKKWVLEQDMHEHGYVYMQ